jgi:RNA polymerase sigma-70 factor (ECF subfamily)
MSRATVQHIASVTPSAREFEELFKEHYRAVYHAAYRVMRSEEDAEDILQVVFLKMLGRELPVEFRRNPKGYLCQIAVNESLNLLRWRKRQRLKDDVDVYGLEIPVLADGPSTEDDREQRLRKAMARLKPEAVEILKLHYEQDLSDAEIAKVLGKSRSNVAVTLNRARARLKELMCIPGKLR